MNSRSAFLLKTILLTTTMIILISISAWAQVSISTSNTTPDSSAMLDIQSTDKGVLIPRMTATERDAIFMPANGLMVYVTTDSSFYFYEGNAWAKVGRQGWGLKGNTGNVDGTNFIGNTDDVPLDFRVNNNRLLRLEYTGTSGANIIAGGAYNSVSTGLQGATIAGGGGHDYGIDFYNHISQNGNFGTIGGGNSNFISGKYSTIPGGFFNSISADYGFVAGSGSAILSGHSGTTLFSDFSDDYLFKSEAANEFAVRARGGFRFVTAVDIDGYPTKTVTIDNTGTLTAPYFVGDGSGLTNLPVLNNWKLTGNTGNVDGTNFIGNTDNVPLDFRVNNNRLLRLEDDGNNGANFIAGAPLNQVGSGIKGATIAGGGGLEDGQLYHNTIGQNGNFGTIGGGNANSVDGKYSTIPGGYYNTAHANYSMAMGSFIDIAAGHTGAMLFDDFDDGFMFNSMAAGEFAVRARGGFRFVTAVDNNGNPTKTVTIDSTGTLTAPAFVGDGSGLTGIIGMADNLGNHIATQTLNLNGQNIINGDTVTASAFVGDGSGLTGIIGIG